MPEIEVLNSLTFLSELYAQDSPKATLLAEYPSSNTDATLFQNHSKFIIHDPFPPPPPELLKTLGPHHLMCGWGDRLPVTSQLQPPPQLIEHWSDLFGDVGCPIWKPWDADDQSAEYITLFPHESIAVGQQQIDPELNYQIHSKSVIEKMHCRQAEVLPEVRQPCIVKLSHGYAGLGNYLIRTTEDETKMRADLASKWPNAELIVNSIVENIVGDYGVQFYLRRDGSVVWLGFTEQKFSETNRWCGGTYSSSMQSELKDSMTSHVLAAAEYLASVGYFGVVGIDLLRNTSEQYFLVDVNPRLTGITPFLMMSRSFQRDLGLGEGVYFASVHFTSGFERLLNNVNVLNQSNDCRVVVLSAYEDRCDADRPYTLCHLSITTNRQSDNQQLLGKVLSV